MRPNIDISWDLHGQIKQFAEDQQIPLEEAYTKIIRDGIDQLQGPEGPIIYRDEEDYNVYFTRHDAALHQVCTFYGGYGWDLTPVVFSTGTQEIHLDKVESILAELQQLISTRYTGGVYTIQQEDGSWLGHGLQSFLQSLRHQKERYESHDVSTHKVEMAVYVGDAVSGRVIVNGTFKTHDDVFDRFNIAFITDGHPVDSRPFTRFADRANLRLGKASPWEPADQVEIDVNDVEDVPVQPVEEVVMEDSVIGLICENPFYKDEESFEHYFGDVWPDSLIGFEHIYCHLHDWDDPGSEYEYTARQFRVSNYNIVRNIDFQNVFFEANW